MLSVEGDAAFAILQESGKRRPHYRYKRGEWEHVRIPKSWSVVRIRAEVNNARCIDFLLEKYSVMMHKRRAQRGGGGRLWSAAVICLEEGGHDGTGARIFFRRWCSRRC